MSKTRITLAVIVLLAGAAWFSHLPAETGDGEGTFQDAAGKVQDDLQKSLEELAALRERIAAEKLPLTRELSALERRLLEIRAEYDGMSRTLDTRNLDLANLRTEIEARKEEKTYLSNLLDEYARNFETRLHINELQRYRPEMEEARMAPETADLGQAEIYRSQMALLDTSLDRLLELVGGATFDGQAVGPDGMIRDAKFALVGPISLYSAADGSSAGLAEQRLGSLEPNMIPFETPGDVEYARALVASGSGRMPFDPSMGNARKIEAQEDTFTEHVAKGGVVMWPILIMAFVAVVVGILKAIQLARVPAPPARDLEALLESVRKGDHARAKAQVKKLPGPTGAMLQAGMEYIHESKELVEEVMYERMLETRLKLQSWLPFIALCASAAPLLGLLGTVTGMINTFKLITVFGSGDATTLSSGISEALITTKFGLIVAIPSLLFYAFLTRWSKRLSDGMEKTAVKLLNRIQSTSRLTEPTDELVEKAG